MNNSLKSYLILGLLISGLASPSAFSATIYNVTDWYATATNAISISNGGTNSPTLNYKNTGTTNNYASTSLWSYFADNASPASLTNGSTLTLSVDITVDFTTASSKSIPIRFGLFDSSSPRATTDGAGGTYNYTSTRIGTGSTSGLGANSQARNGWSGILAGDGVASGTSSIYQRDPSSTSTVWSSTGSGVTGSSVLTTGIINQTFVDNEPISLNISLKRIGADLEFYGILGANSFSGTYAGYFTNDYPETFDTFGIYLNGASGASPITSLLLENATLTLVPEPSAGMLILGASGMGAILLMLGRGMANNKNSNNCVSIIRFQ